VTAITIFSASRLHSLRKIVSQATIRAALRHFCTRH
jgi:hypothetical protein